MRTVAVNYRRPGMPVRENEGRRYDIRRRDERCKHMKPSPRWFHALEVEELSRTLRVTHTTSRC